MSRGRGLAGLLGGSVLMALVPGLALAGGSREASVPGEQGPEGRRAEAPVLTAGVQVQATGAGPGPALEVWATDPWTERLLERGDDVAATAAGPEETGDADTVLVLRPEQAYQTMDGFGASMTDSAAWTISRLPEAEQRALMRELFDPATGLGISFLRQPMGSPDFARMIRSYNDLPPEEEDPTQAKFDLGADKDFIIPLLKEALAINPGITFMGSPWSPPAWMKTGGTMLGASGGVLKPELYQSYATYFVKFIEAYRAEGIPMHYVSPQNEPAYGPPAYPGMVWPADQVARFVREALGPALEGAGLSTRILVWDHNWDQQTHAATILADPATARWVAGSAWHYYGGVPQAMASIKGRFPDKDIWFTEGGSGRWIGGDTFPGQFKDGIQNAIRICQNWSKSVVWWNIALDQRNGPIVFPNTANYGLVEIDTDRGVLRRPYHAGFYTLGHFSRFVKPGAVRIGLDAGNQDLVALAFRNPDGSLVVVVANPYTSSQTARIVAGDSAWEVEVPGDGAVSCVIPVGIGLRN